MTAVRIFIAVGGDLNQGFLSFLFVLYRYILAHVFNRFSRHYFIMFGVVMLFLKLLPGILSGLS